MRRRLVSPDRARSAGASRAPARLRWSSESGVSLVEMMVVTSFLLIVTGSIWAMLDSGLRVQTSVTDRIVASDNARVGMDLMVKEIRSIKNWDSSYTMTGTQLRFVEVSGVSNESHLMTYRLDQTDMNRQKIVRTDVKRVNGVVVSTISSPIADYVINAPGEPLFTYYDAFQNEITTAGLRPGSTRLVAIHIVAKKRAAAATGEVDLRTSVAMRN